MTTTPRTPHISGPARYEYCNRSATTFFFFSVAWLGILQCLRDEFKWVQDGRTEQNARWIMSSNRCRISFFHICGDGVREHQHIPTSGAFKWQLGFCLCGTDLKICTLKGLKVKRFAPDRKESLWCCTRGNSIASHTHTAAQNSSIASAIRLGSGIQDLRQQQMLSVAAAAFARLPDWFVLVL